MAKPMMPDKPSGKNTPPPVPDRAAQEIAAGVAASAANHASNSSFIGRIFGGKK